jgi:hypothetical protein
LLVPVENTWDQSKRGEIYFVSLFQQFHFRVILSVAFGLWQHCSSWKECGSEEICSSHDSQRVKRGKEISSKFKYLFQGHIPLTLLPTNVHTLLQITRHLNSTKGGEPKAIYKLNEMSTKFQCQSSQKLENHGNIKYVK